MMSELDFGSFFLTRGVYAVTGSNGKTTTVEFLTHTLVSIGQNAVAVGNNGRSLCAWLAENLDSEPDTRLVVEISSQQAMHLQNLPIDGLIWTNFSENHLDVHGSMEEYFGVKHQLIKHLQKPLFVVGQSVFEYSSRFNIEMPDYTLVVTTTGHAAEDALPVDSALSHRPFDENFRLCVAFGERIGIPRILFHQAANTFALPKHRLIEIAEIKGVEFWNDAKCTTFAATLGALERFDRQVLWIGGGRSKGGDLATFAKHLAPSLKAAYLIGETGELMTSLLRREAVAANACQTLENAVKTAFLEATRGDIILFSPGFASTDQFENFVQRGNSFEKIVFELRSRQPASTKA